MNVVAKQSMGMLRQSLFEILEGLKTGKIDSQRACAAAKVAQTLLNSVETQLKFQELQKEIKLAEKLPEMDLVAGPTEKPTADQMRERELQAKRDREQLRESMRTAGSA